MAAKIDNTWTGNGVVNAQINLVNHEWTRLGIRLSDAGGSLANVVIEATSSRGTHGIAIDLL